MTELPPMALPDLPLGLQMEEHLAHYLDGLAALVDNLKSHPVPIDVTAGRMLSAVYEDLNTLLEFKYRELKLERGGDEVSATISLDGLTAFITVTRSGNAAFEFAMDKTGFAQFINDQQDLLEEMK